MWTLPPSTLQFRACTIAGFWSLVGIAAAMSMLACSGMSDSSANKLTSIAVSPANPSIAVAATIQFAATGTFGDGSTRSLSPNWSSSATDIATISGAGLATAVAPHHANSRNFWRSQRNDTSLCRSGTYAAIDNSDSCKSFSCRREHYAIYCHRNLQRWEHKEPDQFRDVEFLSAEYSEHEFRRAGNRRSGRCHDDNRKVR